MKSRIQCDYHKREAERQEAVSYNRAARMIRPRLALRVVPEHLPHPMVRVAYDAQGDYLGAMKADDDAPEGTAKVILQPAVNCGCRR